MGRAHKIAAIYLLTDTINGKVYIGESSNISDRLSSYRTLSRMRSGEGYKYSRPIEQAILEHSLNAFSTQILLSSDEDPKLVDPKYRLEKEAEYIAKYNATDPSVGYNIQAKSGPGFPKRTKKGVKHTTRTKMIKSKPILVYDKDDNSVMLYMNAQNCAELLGFSDRSIITSALKKGKCVHNKLFYRLDFADRIDTVNNIIKTKLANKSKNNLAITTLKEYLNGLDAINDWCREFHVDEVDVDELRKLLTN